MSTRTLSRTTIPQKTAQEESLAKAEEKIYGLLREGKGYRSLPQ